jgi:hypothetical protein
MALSLSYRMRSNVYPAVTAQQLHSLHFPLQRLVVPALMSPAKVAARVISSSSNRSNSLRSAGRRAACFSHRYLAEAALTPSISP